MKNESHILAYLHLNVMLILENAYQAVAISKLQEWWKINEKFHSLRPQVVEINRLAQLFWENHFQALIEAHLAFMKKQNDGEKERSLMNLASTFYVLKWLF